jgi:hypothetical protein
LSIDLAVKILSDLLLLTVSVLYHHRPLAALLATPTAAIELLVGIQGHHEQARNLAPLQLFVDLELTDHPGQDLTKLFRIVTFQGVAKGIVTDGLGPTHKPLPPATIGLPLQL